jgi:hypothetical protein
MGHCDAEGAESLMVQATTWWPRVHRLDSPSDRVVLPPGLFSRRPGGCARAPDDCPDGPDRRAPSAPVAAAPYRGTVDHNQHYANAVRAEPGICWRMIARPDGFRVDTPTACPLPVAWSGYALVGARRMRLWSCDRHAEGLDDLRPDRRRPPPVIGSGTTDR